MREHVPVMFSDIWKRIRAAVLAAGVLLSFLAVLEVIRAYQTLRDLHWVLGWVFALGLAGAAGWLAWHLWRSFYGHGPVLVPPGRIDLNEAAGEELRSYAWYLRAFLTRLSRNPNVPDGDRGAARAAADELSATVRSSPSPGVLRESLARAAREVVAPAVARLDELGEKEVRSCVAATMAGVALSPWRSADLLIVLGRNLAMLRRIVGIYNSRPRVREQMLILRDVAGIVATVNYLNFGSRLVERVFARVPVVGPFADDIAEGVGAGLMTSIAGHAAVDRCRAYRSWSQQEAADSIHARLRQFSQDLRGILFHDFIPQLRQRIRSQAQWAREDPDATYEQVKDALAVALAETDGEMESFVRERPLNKGRAYVRRGAGYLAGAAAGTGRTAAAYGRKGSDAAARAARTAWRKAAAGAVRADRFVKERLRKRGPSGEGRDEPE